MTKELSWPPAICPHCQCERKLSTSHLWGCPARGGDPAYHEVFPGLFVGSVEARVDPRFVAVVSILTEAQSRYIGAALAQPRSPMAYIDHEDRVPGLVAKCGPAWEHIDRHIPRGDVLVHCYQGASRSVTAATGWIVTRRGRRVLDEVPRIAGIRPQAVYLFEGYVRELEALERGALTASGAPPPP